MAENINRSKYGSTIPLESIQQLAETKGIADLTYDASKKLAKAASFQAKHIIDNAAKFMHHAIRTKLISKDVDATLRSHCGDYSLSSKNRRNHQVNSKKATGANAEPQIEIKLQLQWMVNNIQTTTPKTPISGVKPASAEALSEEKDRSRSLVGHKKTTRKTETQRVSPMEVTYEGIEEAAKSPLKPNENEDDASETPALETKIAATDSIKRPSRRKFSHIETVQLKQLATHELSMEQLQYYKAITEGCMGYDEGRRARALHSLTTDPEIYELLPRLSAFIKEAIQVNVVQSDLAILIYLIRMIKALVDNETLYLKKCLHEIIPSIVTCIVTKKMCARPELDNHWALRDFAARLTAEICRKFSNSTNNIQNRVIHLFRNALLHVDTVPLSTVYGAIDGLSELGPNVTKTFIIPRVKSIGSRIQEHLDGPLIANCDRVASEHIKILLVKVLTPILRNIRNPPDCLDEYGADYGYLGCVLHLAVLKARMQPMPPPVSQSFVPTNPPFVPTNAFTAANSLTESVFMTPSPTLARVNSQFFGRLPIDPLPPTNSPRAAAAYPLIISLDSPDVSANSSNVLSVNSSDSASANSLDGIPANSSDATGTSSCDKSLLSTINLSCITPTETLDIALTDSSQDASANSWNSTPTNSPCSNPKNSTTTPANSPLSGLENSSSVGLGSASNMCTNMDLSGSDLSSSATKSPTNSLLIRRPMGIVQQNVLPGQASAMSQPLSNKRIVVVAYHPQTHQDHSFDGGTQDNFPGRDAHYFANRPPFDVNFMRHKFVLNQENVPPTLEVDDMSD